MSLGSSCTCVLGSLILFHGAAIISYNLWLVKFRAEHECTSFFIGLWIDCIDEACVPEYRPAFSSPVCEFGFVVWLRVVLFCMIGCLFFALCFCVLNVYSSLVAAAAEVSL